MVNLNPGESDLENTKERPLDKPSQDQANLPHWAEFESFRNGAFVRFTGQK